MRRLAGLLLVAPALAAAQPAPPPSPPDAKPVPWPPLFGALRVGWQSESFDSCCYDLSGTGVSIDGEAGYRFDDWVSLSGFFAYGTIHGDSHSDMLGTMAERKPVLDIGMRANLHVSSIVFVGGGLGLESYDADQKGRLDRTFELHAGIVLPRIHHIAPELFVIKVYGAGDWENGTPDVESTRIAVGFEAW